MAWPFAYFVAWIFTAALAGIFVHICIKVAPRFGFVDIPQHEAHKNHRKSTPVMGGIGMLTGWLAALALGLCICIFAPKLLDEEIGNTLAGLDSVKLPLCTIILGAILVTILGMTDDRHAMHALPKFLGQALVAGIVAALGLRISFLHVIPGANWVVTILWIMTLMNAMNFFDNMDGLAAGASALAALFFLFVAALRGQNFVAVLAAVTGGAATGFLIFNAPPAKIFMGDGGSHFLGFMLAVIGILTTFYLPGDSLTPAPILIPLFVLGVPLFDAVAVVIIRMRLGVPVYKGDNRHISHRFVKLGLSRPQAVLLVHLLCVILGVSGLTLLWLPAAGFMLVLALVSSVFAVISIIQFYVVEAGNHGTK